MCNETNKSYLQTIYSHRYTLNKSNNLLPNTLVYVGVKPYLQKLSVALVMLSQVYLSTISLTQ